MWGSWDAFETHDVSHLKPSALPLSAAGPSFALMPGSVAKQELIAAQSQAAAAQTQAAAAAHRDEARKQASGRGQYTRILNY